MPRGCRGVACRHAHRGSRPELSRADGRLALCLSRPRCGTRRDSRDGRGPGGATETLGSRRNTDGSQDSADAATWLLSFCGEGRGGDPSLRAHRAPAHVGAGASAFPERDRAPVAWTRAVPARGPADLYRGDGSVHGFLLVCGSQAWTRRPWTRSRRCTHARARHRAHGSRYAGGFSWARGLSGPVRPYSQSGQRSRRDVCMRASARGRPGQDRHGGADGDVPTACRRRRVLGPTAVHPALSERIRGTGAAGARLRAGSAVWRAAR